MGLVRKVFEFIAFIAISTGFISLLCYAGMMDADTYTSDYRGLIVYGIVAMVIGVVIANIVTEKE